MNTNNMTHDPSDLPVSSADYDKEFPITHDPHTCKGCNREYTEKEFFALPVPAVMPEWSWPDTTAVFASRFCATLGCGRRLGRRIK